MKSRGFFNMRPHPKRPAGTRLVAAITVIQGAQQQLRCLTVFEREYV